jgi:hypothetical protein
MVEIDSHDGLVRQVTIGFVDHWVSPFDSGDRILTELIAILKRREAILDVDDEATTLVTDLGL